jgi:glucosylceramidase
MTAAKNPDGSITVILLNPENKDQAYAIRMDGKVIRVKVPAQTLSTLIIEA